MMTDNHNTVFPFPGHVDDPSNDINRIARTPSRHLAKNYCDTQSGYLKFDVPDDPVDPQERKKKARANAISGDAEARVKYLERDVYIHTPDFLHVSDTVETLMTRAWRFSSPGGMRILGSGGTGKDTIIRYFLEKYPPVHIGNVNVTPILVIRLRERPSLRQLLEDLMMQMDGMYNKSYSLDELEKVLLVTMKDNKTIAIFFNECQHLLSVTVSRARTKTRITGLAGDWLKFFLDNMEVPLFFFGTPGWDDVLEEEEAKQLATRLTHRFKFSEFMPDAVFVGCLAALDEALPMPEPAGLAEPTMAKAIFQVCKGNWRRLIALLREALIVATEEGSPCIKADHLRRAYRTQFGVNGNPFE